MVDKPIKVLHVEDNPADARLIWELLKESKTTKFDLVHVEELDKALESLRNDAFDALLLDLNLPDSRGLETIEKALTRAPHMPIIALTGLTDEEYGVKAVQMGAQDYLIKGQVNRDLLMRSILYAIERKRAEMALWESEERYRQLVDMSPETIAVHSAEGKLLYLNPAGVKLIGASTSDEVIGKSIWDIVHPDSHELVRKRVTQALKEGKSVPPVEEKFVSLDGKIIIGEVTTTPVVYAEKKALLTVIQDITKRKQIEKELKNHTEHLEEEVRKQAIELIQTEKMASMGLLVAGVAHEINNPLAFIKSNNEFVLEDLKKLEATLGGKKGQLETVTKAQKLLRTNADGIKRIADITKALKSFAKSDAEGRSPADINQGLKDTLTILQNQLKHRVQVHEEYGALPQIECNIGQLNQVFMNIIMNASEAMDKGDIWIKTWTDNKNIYVKIKDNGEGIPRDRLNKVFDPFSSTKKSGTGLGLSVSHRIVQDHKGSISVESEVGKGTTFTIRLPKEAQK